MSTQLGTIGQEHILDYVMVEAAARLVLEKYRLAHPQWTDDVTPLDALAAWLHLDITTFDVQDYPLGTYGFMDADDDENLVWLCRDLPENLRRFTLAHEIGHALLHCQHGTRLLTLSPQLPPALVQQLIASDDEQLPALSHESPCQENDVQEDMASFQDQEQMRQALGAHDYNPRSERELMANIFAAELLMPRQRLITLFLHEGVSARKMADTFRVSQVALLNRLMSLLPDMTTSHSEDVTGEEAIAEQTAGEQATTTPATTKKRYDDYQQAAINAQTPALIVAGPGSGKTSTLIGRVEYLVNTLGIAPPNILALTFSRKATQEMEERLRGVLDVATAGLPRVSTFHAFCADLLRQYGTLVGLRADFALIDEAEGYFLLRQQANTLRLRHYQKLQAPAYYFPDLLKVISRAKDELISPEELAQLGYQLQERASTEEELVNAEKILEIASAYASYQQALHQQGDTDFGGLLMLTIQLLREHPEICQQQQQKYQHILVDEFQDVNRASGVLLRELAGQEQRVWVVGDANQAIYGFRGASPANIQQFTHDFTAAHIFPLNRNYRSQADLVTLAEAFRTQKLEQGEEPGKNQPVRPASPETNIILAEASDERSEIAGIINDIRDKHRQGYAYKDMVILCRTRAQAQKISRALSAATLPVLEQGGVLDQEHIKDLISILLLLCNESGMGLLRAARMPAHTINQQDIESVLLSAYGAKQSPLQLLRDGTLPLTLSIEGRHALQRLTETMQALIQGADTIWFMLAQYLLIESTLLRDLILDPARSEQQRQGQLSDYNRLLQMARHYDQQQARRLQELQQAQAGTIVGETAEEQSASQQPTPEPLPLPEQVKGFIDYLNLLVLLRQDNGSQQESHDTEEQEDIIRVMTVHASKGLEFPVVYLPGLMQRRFPSQARTTAVSAPIELLTGMAGTTSHESGEACLFYVGVTRARDQLILSHSRQQGKLKYKRSPYLDALESGLTEQRITRLYWEHTHTNPTEAQQPVQQSMLASEPPLSAFSTQPGEEFINTMQSKRLSINALETYQSCPRKYAYSNIYHFSNAPDSYQLFWQATQQTVEELHKRLIGSADPQPQEAESTSEFPTSQEVSELYTQFWQELKGHTMPFSTLYEEHGQEIVEKLRQQLHIHNQKEEKVNRELRRNFEVTISDQTVHVPVDRVETTQEENSKEATVFVRTRYGQRKEAPSASMRELFYTLASRQEYPDQEIELHSHNLSTGERTPIKLTSRKEQSLYEEAQQALGGLKLRDFAARPDEPYRCPTCPFFWICPV